MRLENGNFIFLWLYVKVLSVVSFAERHEHSPVQWRCIIKHTSWPNLGLETAKRGKLKMDSIFLIFFNVLYEEADTGGVLSKKCP